MSDTGVTQSFEIKTAREADLSSILEINTSFFSAYNHDESFFREGIAAGHVLVARSSGSAVGYLIYQVWWGNTPFLALIRVLPEFRGKGLGKKLLTLCEEKLKKEGYEALISSSERSNAEGNAFHHKMGFEPIGMLQMIYGEENFYCKSL